VIGVADKSSILGGNKLSVGAGLTMNAIGKRYVDLALADVVDLCNAAATGNQMATEMAAALDDEATECPPDSGPDDVS